MTRKNEKKQIYKRIVKLITLTAIAAFAISPLVAQTYSIEEGSSTDLYEQKQSEEIEFTVGGTHYFFTYHFKSPQRHFYLQSTPVGGGAIQAGELKIDVGVFNSSNEIEEVVGLGDHAYALVTNLDKDAGKASMVARKIDPNGTVAEGGTEVMQYAFEKIMRSGYFAVATSPDHKMMAVVATLPFDKKSEAKLKISVYDDQLNEVSTGEYTIPGEDMRNKRIEVQMANDGTVYFTRFTNTIKEGYGLLVHQYNSKSKSVENTFDIKMDDDYKMLEYNYGVSPKNELVITGTFYEVKTLTTGLDPKADHIFFYTNKNKTENLFEKSEISTPAENLMVTEILFSGETTFVTTEQIKEERIDNPSNPASTEYNYRYNHGNEYIFGFNEEGKKAFELILEQSFSMSNFHRQYASAHHIINGNLIVLYNDAFSKYQNSGDSAGSSVIPVAVQIDPSGLMKPAVTFKNDLKLSSGHTMYTCYSLTEGNSIVTMIRHLNTMKIATIKVN